MNSGHTPGIERYKTLIVFTILLICAFLAFGAAIPGPFHFDDKRELLENPNMRDPKSFWSPLIQVGNLPVRPVPYLSFALNFYLHGNQPVGFHLVNIGIHVVTAFFIYLIFLNVLNTKKYLSESPLTNILLSSGIALIWMIHPIQTQPVNYIYQRIELFMSMFFVLTIYFYMRSVWSRTRFAGYFYFYISLLSCISGMLSKEVMVVAPIAVIWFDRVILAGSWKEIYTQRISQIFLLFSTWLVLILFMYFQDYPEYQSPTLMATPYQYLLTESEVLCHYLKLIFYPSPLVFDYNWPLRKSLSEVLLPGLFIVLLLSVTFFLMIRKPVTGLISGWFFLLLGVTSSFNPVLQPACEHRLHLALLGPVLIVVLLIYLLSKKISGENQLRCRTVFVTTTCLIGIVLISVSASRSLMYRDFCTLWLDTAAKQPDHALALYQLGTEYLDREQNELAEKYCRDATKVDPEHGSAWNNMGLAMYRQGRIEEAVIAYKKAMEVQPGLANCYLNLGNYYLGNADKNPEHVDTAIKYFLQALERNERLDTAYVNLGVAYGRYKKDIAKAIMYWEVALSINPYNLNARDNLKLVRGY